jgi:hypothetical protein
LNSSIAQLIVMSYTVETAISTHVLHNIYIPVFNTGNASQVELSRLSIKAHKLAKRLYEENNIEVKNELIKVEEEIDEKVAKLYEVSYEELKEIKDTLKILHGEEIEEDRGVEN